MAGLRQEGTCPDSQVRALVLRKCQPPGSVEAHFRAAGVPWRAYVTVMQSGALGVSRTRDGLAVGSRKRRLTTLCVQQPLGVCGGSCRHARVLGLRARGLRRDRGGPGPGVAIWDAVSRFKW